MATQIGLLRITGTVGEICFYKLDGVYYARQKSSLTGKRVKTDPAFAETMRNATQLGNASTIASAIYRQTVPQAERSRERFREVVSMVKRGWPQMNTNERRFMRTTNCTNGIKAGNIANSITSSLYCKSRLSIRYNDECHSPNTD